MDYLFFSQRPASYWRKTQNTTENGEKNVKNNAKHVAIRPDLRQS